MEEEEDVAIRTLTLFRHQPMSNVTRVITLRSFTSIAFI